MTVTTVARRRGHPRTTRNLHTRTVRLHKDLAEAVYAKGATFQGTKVSTVYAAVLATAMTVKTDLITVTERLQKITQKSELHAVHPDDQTHVSVTFPSKTEATAVFQAMKAFLEKHEDSGIKQYHLAGIIFNLWTSGKIVVQGSLLSRYKP